MSREGHFDWRVMAIGVIAVIIGSQIGAKVMQEKMKAQWIKQAFGVLLLLVAVNSPGRLLLICFTIDAGGVAMQVSMHDEEIEAIRALAARGKAFGERWDTLLEAAFLVHGHVCGAMPLGFRAGVTALKALGVERERNMAKAVVVETGTGHAAGCFADGVQMSTGCTFGKGLIQRAEYGKWALTLVEKATGKAVRLSVRPEVMQASFDSAFVKMRHQGVPPTQVPLEISTRLVEGIMAKSDDELFTVADVLPHRLPEAAPASFTLVTCAVCGEAVAENKARLKDGKPMCVPCAGYAS